MTSPRPDITALEARLIAHRKLFIRMIQTMPKADRDELQEWLVAASIMHDGQEDPGAVADPGVAFELAMADEMRLLRDKLAAGPSG